MYQFCHILVRRTRNAWEYAAKIGCARKLTSRYSSGQVGTEVGRVSPAKGKTRSTIHLVLTAWLKQAVTRTLSRDLSCSNAWRGKFKETAGGKFLNWWRHRML